MALVDILLCDDYFRERCGQSILFLGPRWSAGHTDLRLDVPSERTVGMDERWTVETAEPSCDVRLVLSALYEYVARGTTDRHSDHRSTDHYA